MIKYLTHEQIDFAAWDACIRRSAQPLVYGMSWYLDVVAPGWDALVEDDYRRVMPLVHRRKAGFKYLYQPAFSQQLGVFGEAVSITDSQAFIHAIPRPFRFAEIMLNEKNPIDISGVKMLTNITLELSCSIEELRSRYNDNSKRSIKKALQQQLSVHKGFDIEKTIELFRNNKGHDVHKNETWYDTLRTLAFQLKHKGMASTYTAIDQHNDIVAGILTVSFEGRVILLFSGSGPEARDSGAMHFLVDAILSDVCSSEKLFDFEGSNNENLARFYLGFGGQKKEYPFVRVNRLPFWLRWMK